VAGVSARAGVVARRRRRVGPAPHARPCSTAAARSGRPRCAAPRGGRQLCLDRCDVRVSIDPPARVIDDGLVYSLAREPITNVVKHFRLGAHASREGQPPSRALRQDHCKTLAHRAYIGRSSCLSRGRWRMRANGNSWCQGSHTYVADRTVNQLSQLMDRTTGAGELGYASSSLAFRPAVSTARVARRLRFAATPSTSEGDVAGGRRVGGLVTVRAT
jgi:hypothetical protein